MLARGDELLFPGLADMLDKAATPHCDRCRYRLSYGAETPGEFGGVDLCDSCRAEWQSYLRAFPARARDVFPVLRSPARR